MNTFSQMLKFGTVSSELSRKPCSPADVCYHTDVPIVMPTGVWSGWVLVQELVVCVLLLWLKLYVKGCWMFLHRYLQAAASAAVG